MSKKDNLIYLGTDFETHSDEKYRQRIDEDHHKAGDIPLNSLL